MFELCDSFRKVLNLLDMFNNSITFILIIFYLIYIIFFNKYRNFKIYYLFIVMFHVKILFYKYLNMSDI